MTARKRAAYVALMLVLAVALVPVTFWSTAHADPGLAGSAGTDTSLPATDSAVTLPGRDRFADLKVSVNQTKDLANQAISVTWTGGRPSIGFNANWLQIFQCWGNDDGTHPENPGPAPEQCEYGGQPIFNDFNKIPSDARPSNVYTRAIANDTWSTFQPPDPPCSAPCATSQGWYNPSTGKLWMPFRAVDGTVVNEQVAPIPIVDNGVSTVSVAWQNPYFRLDTTNEDDWGKTYGNGQGAVLFQADTGLEAPGLGCGQKVQEQPDGSKTIPKCWLVVVPRGTPAEENPDNLSPDVNTSVEVPPIAPQAWVNRIAFPLDFNPVDAGCAIGGSQRRIVGGELPSRAVTNWQPTLCATPDSPPYAFQAIGDDQARRQILSAAPGAAGMAIVSNPLDPADVDPENPVTYAPVALSGVVIGFNVERVPTDYQGNVVDPGEPPIAGVRVTHINLTPRIVAKLLTQSYQTVFPNLDPNNVPAGYEWVHANQPQPLQDPDFLQFNPEFNIMRIGSTRTASSVVVEAPNSDAATAVWRWILADPEAKAWLAGTPDAWGMTVNPLFNTDATKNPTGAGFAPANAFPKNDPYCYQAPKDGDITPRPLCLFDSSPYALTMEQAAQETRAANDKAATTHDVGSASQQSGSTYWGSDGPQRQGARSILSITDSASAVRYGLQTASLSRAGDDAATRAFVAPDDAGLLSGLKAMVPTAVNGVLQADPTTQADGVYPLPMLSYAATTPRSLDAAARKDYAAFVTYATGPGQTPGVGFGQLPPGYAPLPADLRAQAAAAAVKIATGDPAPAPPTEPAPAPAPVPAPTVDGTTVVGDVTLSPLPSVELLPATGVEIPSVLPATTTSGFPGGRTPRSVIGYIRYTLPIVLAIGLLAVLGVLAFDDQRLRALALTNGRGTT